MTSFRSPWTVCYFCAGAAEIIYGRVGSSHLLQLLIGLSSRRLKPRSKLISFLRYYRSAKRAHVGYNLVITYSFLVKSTLGYSGFPVHRIDVIALKNLQRTRSKFVDYYIPNKGHLYSWSQFISWRPYKGLVGCWGLCETDRQKNRQTYNHLLRSHIHNLLTHILWPYSIIDQWLTFINPVHFFKTCFCMIYLKSFSQFKPISEKWTFDYAVIQQGTVGTIPNSARSRRPTNKSNPLLLCSFDQLRYCHREAHFMTQYIF